MWFDEQRLKQGHEFQGFGIAAVAAGQLSKLDNGFIRNFIVRNEEVTQFVNKGSNAVFEFAFPLMQKIYYSKTLILKEQAKIWIDSYGLKEQCEILDPLYKALSYKAIKRLSKMAKGQGIFKLGVPGRLRFEGDITNCESRFEHAKTKILPHYLLTKEN